MHRFFVDIDQLEDNEIKIIGKDVKHIKDVLRLREGENIEIVSHGNTYISQILSLNSDSIITNIIESFPGENEPMVDIILYQGIPKGDKMEYIIQKNVELGIKEIYPIVMNRTVVKFKDKKKEINRINRWQSISDEASKQSKRDILPKINDIISFKEMLEILKDKENIIVPYEEEKTLNLKDILKDNEAKEVHLIIGPEGGFEEDEIEALKEINGQIISLGPRILRTETAGLVVSSIVLYEFGSLEMIK
ncbi:MAG: 16S rRNA (uracil(1498)-N(3))-methyltransferase [Tissierellia bacterium]|nr:16S rRNA (uracil(1498)-N(3))-methyltransferase [Tissierellia bacterium]